MTPKTPNRKRVNLLLMETILSSTVKAEAKCSKVHSFAVAEIFMVIRL